MELWKRFWVLVTRLLHFTTLSALNESDVSQHPLELGEPAAPPEPEFVHPPVAMPVADDPLHWRPPGHRQDDGDGSLFKCDYRAMVGWTKCSTPEDRSCWLSNPITGERFDINTDYENKWPTGVKREYWLTVTKSSITADGYTFNGATVFNETYPGPWIQACWGDTVVVHVTNKNRNNGTSIHVSKHLLRFGLMSKKRALTLTLTAPVAWNPAAQHNANGRREWSHSVSHCPRQHLHLPVGRDAIRFSVVSFPLQRPVC